MIGSRSIVRTPKSTILRVTRRLSVYRFWRDLGYAVGALASGVIADIFGFEAAILAIAALTFTSGILAASLMQNQPG